jgi:hypothetical protein
VCPRPLHGGTAARDGPRGGCHRRHEDGRQQEPERQARSVGEQPDRDTEAALRTARFAARSLAALAEPA